MGVTSGTKLNHWGKQEKAPNAPAGLQQAAGAARDYQPGSVLAGTQLGQQVRQEGYVDTAQSWYSGANMEGTTNGWDNAFTDAFIAGQERAAEQGTLGTYFAQEDATGVVTWDHTIDGERYQFGDVFQDGKKVGNVYDQFKGHRATADLMMAEWLFGKDEKGEIFGSNDPKAALRQAVAGKREQNNIDIPKALGAADFASDVKDRAKEMEAGATDEAITAGGVAGGAALGAGAGAAAGAAFFGIGAIPGAVIGGVIGGVAGGVGAEMNTDALTEQAARAAEITEMASREHGDLAGFATGVEQWAGFGSRLISPMSNIVQGLTDVTKGRRGDGTSEFYRTDKAGDRTVSKWARVADVGASVGDMALQFASPIGAALFTTQMTSLIGGEVSAMAASGGEVFDYRRGGFVNTFTDDDGNFDLSRAAAGIGKVGIDAVQLGMGRGLLAKTQASRVAAGEAAVGAAAPGLLGRIGQRLYGGAGQSERLAGYKFLKNEAGEVVGKKATLSLLAPSEQLTALSARVRGMRAAARREPNTYGVDDFYGAALALSMGERKMTTALVNGMGESYEEGLQYVLEAHSTEAPINGWDMFNAAAYGFAGGFGMGLGTASRTASADQKMFAQAQIAQMIRTGGTTLTKAEWDAKTSVEKRGLAAMARMEREIADAAYRQIAEDQAQEATAGVVGVNKLADAIQSAIKRNVARMTNKTDQTSVIIQTESTPALDENGDLRPGSIPTDAVVASGFQTVFNLSQKGRGLEVQHEALKQKLDRVNADYGRGKIDEEDMQRRTTELTQALELTEQSMIWLRKIEPVLNAHVEAMYDEYATEETVAAEAELLNEKLRRMFHRQYDSFQGEAMTEGDKMALARAVSMLHTRDPQDQAGSYQVLVPQVSPHLTWARGDGNNIIEVSHAILPAISGDFDGDKMRQLNQVYLDEAEYVSARSGAHFVGAGASVNVKAPKYEKWVTDLMTRTLNGPNSALANFAEGVLVDGIGRAVKRRYDGRVDTAVLDEVLAGFYRAVHDGDKDARKKLIDGLATNAGAQITEIARGDLSNEWLWLDQLVRSNMQRFQEVAAEHRAPIGDGPNTNQVAPPARSSAELHQQRVDAATTKGVTMGMLLAGDQEFRQDQKLHYSALVAAVLSAERAGSRDQLRDLALLYEALGQNLTDAEINNMRAKDEITARVFARLRRIALEAQRLDPNLNPAEAVSVVANIRVNDIKVEADGTVNPTGKDITLAQLLLRQSLDEDRAKKDVIWDASEELRNKHAKLRAMTMPQSRTHHGDKGHRPVNAERAFIEVVGSQQLITLLGEDANIFGPHKTVEQFIREYSAQDELARQRTDERLKKDASYIGRRHTKSIPYDLSEVQAGEVSPYRAVVDAMIAVGHNRITIDKDGNLHGEYAKQSREVSKRFRDGITQARTAMFEFVQMSPRKGGELTTEMVERMMRANPDWAKYVMDLIPNSIANGVISPDGKQISNWVFKMFTFKDPREAEMHYYRNILKARTNALNTYGLQREEDEDEGQKGRNYARLPNRIDRILWNLAIPENHHLLQKFINTMEQATDPDEFMRWVNTFPGIRGEQAPLTMWVDDTAEFDPDKAGGGWSTVLEGAELREAMSSLQTASKNLAKDLVEERASIKADAKVIQAVGRVVAFEQGDKSVKLEPGDRPYYNQFVDALRQASERRLGLGPQAMMYQSMMAARGFFPQGHTKGVVAPHLEAAGAIEALRDAYDYVTNYERVLASLTSVNLNAVGGHLAQVARDGGRASDDAGREVEWEGMNPANRDAAEAVGAMLTMMSDPETRSMARAVLFPQVMEVGPDNKIRPALLTGKGLKDLLKGTTYKHLYPHGPDQRLDPDSALRYLAMLEPMAQEFGGHFAVQRTATDRIIAYAAAADHVLTNFELEKLTTEVYHELALELQATASRLVEDPVPGQPDPQAEVMRRVNAEQRRLTVGRRFSVAEIADSEITDSFLDTLVLDREKQATAEKAALVEEARRSNDPAADERAQRGAERIDADLERFKTRMEMMRSDDVASKVVEKYFIPPVDENSPREVRAEAEMKKAIVVEFILDNLNVLERSTNATLPMNKLTNQLLDRGLNGDVTLTAEEWQVLSNSVIGVALDDLLGAAASGVSVPAYPDADHADYRKYVDPAYTYLYESTTSRESPLVQAARKMHVDAKRHGVAPVGDEDYINLLGRTVFKEGRLGPWTSDIQRRSIAANERLDSAAAAAAIAMAGNSPKTQGVITAATRRTYEVPGDELLSRSVLTFTDLRRPVWDEVEVVLPGGRSVLRPLAQLNNRFARSVVLRYTEPSTGDPVEVDLLAEDKNLGYTWHTNDDAINSGLKSVNMARIENSVDRAMARLRLDPRDVQIEVAYFHPDSQPAGPEWMNNLFFEGTSYKLDADRHESLNATLWFAAGSLSQSYQRSALDANKLGMPALQVVPTVPNADRRDLEIDWATDMAGMLRQKTKRLLTSDLGGVELEADEFFNPVYKDMKLRHFVRGVSRATGEQVLLTAEEVIAAQQAGTDLEIDGAALWVPSADVLRTMLGEQGTQGVAEIYDDQLEIDLDMVPSYRGVTPTMMERFKHGVSGEKVPLHKTKVVNRARQGVLTVRRKFDQATHKAFDTKMRLWRGEQESAWADRSDMYRQEEGGFSTRTNLARAIRAGDAALRAENILMDWPGIGVTYIDVRDPSNTDLSKMALVDLEKLLESDGSRSGFIYRHGQTANPPQGLLSEVSLSGGHRKGHMPVFEDLVTIELQWFKGDEKKAQQALDWFVDRGVTVVLVGDGRQSDLRGNLSDYLSSRMYESVHGSDHAYRPAERSSRFQNLRARASTFTETRGVSPRDMLSVLYTTELDIEENAAWRVVDGERDGAIAEKMNLVPVNAFAGFGVPVDDLTNSNQLDALGAHLEVLATEQGRNHMREMANRHLTGEARAVADANFDFHFDLMWNRLKDTGHPLPQPGDDFGTGYMIPLVDGGGRLLLYRHGFKAPRVDQLNRMTDRGFTQHSGPANVAVYPSKPEPAASTHIGRVRSFNPRAGFGLEVELEVDLSAYADKKVLEWSGLKLLTTPKPDNVRLPQHGFLPNGWGVNLIASGHDMVGKEGFDGLGNNHRNWFAITGIDFTQDVARFFNTTPHQAVQLLQAIATSAPRITRDTADELINSDRVAVYVRDMLSEVALMHEDKANVGWVDQLADTRSVEAKITSAMLLYLMTRGARVEHVLKSGGFGDETTDIDAQSRLMPRLFTQVFDKAQFGSDLRVEINRRMNDGLYNPNNDGTGYVLHQDWTFEITVPGTGPALADPTAVSYQLEHGVVYAYVGDTPVGRMTFGVKTGEIGELGVLPDHRRKGIATGMLNFARSQGLTIRHSAIRSEAGEAWAKSLGEGPLPERMTIAEDWDGYTEDVIHQLQDSLKRAPRLKAPVEVTGGLHSIRGFLAFSEVHSSGDNPILNGMTFDEADMAPVSPHSGAILHQATGGEQLYSGNLDKAEAFRKGEGLVRFSSEDALDGGAWRMFTNIDASSAKGWKALTPAESFHLAVGRDAVVQFRQPIDTTTDGWDKKGRQAGEYRDKALQVVRELRLQDSQVGVVDGWVRQVLGQPAGRDRDEIERGEVTGKGALGALDDILWAVEHRYMPTISGEVSQLHAHDLQMIYRANRNHANPWKPKSALDGEGGPAKNWNDWVKISLGSVVTSDNLFDRLFLVALDGFTHTYEHATKDILDLPVSRDAMVGLELLDPNTNRMLVSHDPDTQTMATETMILDSYGATVDDLINGRPIAGKYRGKRPPASEIAKRREVRRKWRKEHDIPMPVEVTMKDFRKNGGDLVDKGTTTNAFFRSLIHLRVGTALLNPLLYMSMGPEQWIRGTLDRAANTITGQATVGLTATAMSKAGVHRYTPDELASLRTLYRNMGQSRAFAGMIFKDLNFRRPHEIAVGKIERGLEAYAKFGSRMQDPTWGMRQSTLARRYLEGALQHIMATPTENVVSISRLAAAMRTDPTFLQKNFPEAHEAGTNAVAQIRSLKQTTASTLINGVVNPMSSSDNALYNAIGNVGLRLPLLFSGYAMNVMTTITGLQGADQMLAMFLEGRKKGPGSFFGRIQAHLNGREFNEADDANFDMSSVLEGIDLSRAFIRGGLTHTGLFAFGMMAGGLGLSGEDDETKKRRKMSELQGAGFVYDPRRIENDFRNADAIFLDWLPFGWDAWFRVGDPEAEGGVRSMAQLNWTLKQFVSPIMGMEKFFETGDFRYVTWGFEDAVGSFPLINTLMWDDAVSTAHEFAKMANEEAKLGGPQNMVNANYLLTNAVGVYERMLFENSFLNMIYVGRDRYDRDPYVLPLRDSDGEIQRTIENNARPNDLALEQYIDPETGMIREGYMGRSTDSATLHALTENRGTLALVSSLFTGGIGESDFWRYNMPTKIRELNKPTMTQADAEAIIRAASEGAGGQVTLTPDELSQIWKNQAAKSGTFVNWGELDQKAIAYVNAVRRGGPFPGGSGPNALSPVNPLAPAPLSVLNNGREELTFPGAKAVLRGLEKGTVQLGDTSLAGIHIPFEMREQIQKEWMKEIKQEGVDMGLDQTKAESRMKRLWYGPIDNPAIQGLGDLLWSKDISYTDKVQYKQLNTTYVMGPDGRPWATGFKRQGLAPVKGAYVSEQSSTGTDSRLNTVDWVNNLNTGLRGLELMNETENVPTDKEIADSIIEAIKEASATQMTPFKPFSSGGGGFSPWRNFGGFGGGGGGFTDFGGGGTTFFSKMYALPSGITPYANGVPVINTSNPLIRRESVRRERVWSERGRLKQWQ